MRWEGFFLRQGWLNQPVRGPHRSIRHVRHAKPSNPRNEIPMTDSKLSPDTGSEFVWSSSKRFWISLIILFHLFCVSLAPLAAVDPRPNLAVDAQRVLRPYSESLYLLHGYRFFAPEPGPSHVMQYEITKDSGETLQGQFPDRNGHWPRLLYHRWFMLSETVFQHVSATLAQDELTQWQTQVEQQIETLNETNPRAASRLRAELNRELQDHENSLAIRDALVNSIGRTLLKELGGNRIDLQLVTRVIPPPQDILMGLKLDHPRYQPPDLKFELGTVYLNTETLESLTPQVEGSPKTPEKTGQGRGANSP